MPNPIRILLPIDCQDPSTWETALTCAREIGGKAQPSANEYILLTHTKSQLKQTLLSSHIGSKSTKTLLENKVIVLAASEHLRHATLKTLSRSVHNAVIIAYFADDKMMEAIDGLIGVIGAVVVPEFLSDVDNWRERWTPIVHGQQPTPPVKLLSDAVVEKALQQLSGRVNLSNTVMATYDKKHANETLRILRTKDHTLEEDKIKSWAIQNGWHPDAAGELAKLAANIQASSSKP